MTLTRYLMPAVLNVVVLFGGCASNPKSIDIVIPAECCTVIPGPYPTHPWVSVHQISARGWFGGRSTLIGLTRGDPEKRTLHSVLLTAEGFVLFEAEMDEDHVRTVRAVPPFDTPQFVRGLKEDVSAIFLFPKGQPSLAGATQDGSRICQWRGKDGSLVELVEVEGGWARSKWNGSGSVARKVLFKSPLINGLPSFVELEVPGTTGYTLDLLLIRGTDRSAEKPRVR